MTVVRHRAANEPEESVRPRSWADPRNVVLVLLVAGYVVARVSLLQRGRPFRSYDSAGYAPLAADVHLGPTLSLTGGTPRPWGVPLLYALADGDRGRMALQWGVGTLSWILLAVGLWVALRGLAARVVAAVAVLGLALMDPVYRWDYAILSESLSISLGVATLGALLIWLRTGWWPALVVTVGAAFWWLFSRQDMLLFVGLLTVLLAVLAWRLRDRRRAALIAAGVLVVGMAWMVAIVPGVDRTFATWSATKTAQTQETFLYRLHVQVMRDPEIRRIYEERFGMPSCPEAVAVSQEPRWEIIKFVAAYDRCPDLVAWGDANQLSSGYRFALAEPGAYVGTLATSLPRALGGGPYSSYAKPVKMLPLPVQRAVFPPPPRELPTLGIALLVVAAAALVAGAFRRGRWLAYVGIGLVVVSLLSILSALTLSAGEYARFGIQEAVLVRVGIIVLLVAAIDALPSLTGRWRRTPAPLPDPVGPPRG